MSFKRHPFNYFVKRGCQSESPHNTMRCHLIVGANIAHKLSTRTPGSCTCVSCIVHRPHSPQYIPLSHVLLMEYKYPNTTDKAKCHCLPSMFFDMFSAFVSPLFFEPVGCAHVTSLVVASTCFL